MNPSSIRPHLQSAFCACLIAAAAVTLFNGLALCAAENPDVLPRYRLKPGQELQYHGESEFKYRTGDQAGAFHYTTDWRVCVVRANGDGSWRLVAKSAEKTSQSWGKDFEDHGTRTRLQDNVVGSLSRRPHFVGRPEPTNSAGGSVSTFSRQRRVV